MQHKGQGGFTLVELAIVLIIIGVLVTGVLKGQELIANSQVTATISQINSIESASSTFQDMYDGMPGDINGGRLPNCTAATGCNPATGITQDGSVQSPFGAAATAEGIAFWLHLDAADLISGINPNGGAVFGGQFPEARLRGLGFHVDYVNAATELVSAVNQIAAGVRRGHYLALHGTPSGAVNNVGDLLPQHAFRIDNKMDDSVGNTGSVQAAGAATCLVGTTGTYNEANVGTDCNLYIRIQQ